MIQGAALVILTLFTVAIVDFPSAALVAVSYLGGKLLVGLFDRKENNYTVRLYGILFLVGWCYMLMCYWYMTAHGYNWLFAFDTINAYIPKTESLISINNGNLLRIYQDIFEDYNFFARDGYFYWAYSCTWGVLINRIGATMYFGLQTSTLFVFGFVGVIMYKLFSQYGFNEKKSFNHTLVVFLLSIIFFYSSQILRDIHVLLTYLIAIYLSGRPKFSVITFFWLIFVIFISCGIRIETGLFLMITIPIYLLLSVQEKRHRFYAIVGSVVVLIVGLMLVIRNMDDFQFVVNANAEAYVEGVEEGSGMIAMFQRIPILGDFISIIYNLSLPMPCWSRLDPTKNLQYGGNVSNIMNFTRISAVFLNVMMYVYVICWLFSNRLRIATSSKLTKALKYQLCAGLIFLYLQSAVISQRRLMGYYCIFYILLFVIYDNIQPNDRKNLNFITLSVFALLQFVGVFFFV